MPSPAGSPVAVAIVGAGSRGAGYANWVRQHPDQARVVAVAEPDAVRRQRLADAHQVPQSGAFTSWEELAAAGRTADAAVIATQDAVHVAPTLALAAQGYAILLEKPLAPTEHECREIVAAVTQADVTFAVAHVLRYTPYTKAVTELVQAGRIGDVVSVQHLEPVGFWHQAHSYVRGNWRNETLSSFMLLAKSCHDLDWLEHVVGRPITRVSSFGGLTHFTAANAPIGAGQRCLDCAVEPDCMYSAPRFYSNLLATGRHHWPLDVVIEEFTQEALDTALRTGPFGRCVYACDNDVVDHQVVAMEFDGGATGTFTMTAFGDGRRQTRLFGTKGELLGDEETLVVHDFRSGEREVISMKASGDGTVAGGHGGGDAGLMSAFVAAVATGDRSRILTGPEDSLASHLAVFAAERSRVEGRVVDVARQPTAP